MGSIQRARSEEHLEDETFILSKNWDPGTTADNHIFGVVHRSCFLERVVYRYTAVNGATDDLTAEIYAAKSGSDMDPTDTTGNLQLTTDAALNFDGTADTVYTVKGGDATGYMPEIPKGGLVFLEFGAAPIAGLGTISATLHFRTRKA